MRNLYLVAGPSAIGKTATVKLMEQKYGVKRGRTWTTRAPRFEGEDDYTFVTSEQFHEQKNITAYGLYAGNEYGVPVEVLKKCDVCILEPAGIRELKERFPEMNICVILFDADRELCEERMRQRGDSEESIQKRLETDTEVFADVTDIADYRFYIVKEKNVEQNAKELYELICGLELCSANDELHEKYPGINAWLVMATDNAPDSVPEYVFQCEEYITPSFRTIEEVFSTACDYLDTPYLRILNQIKPETQNGGKLIHVARAALPMCHHYCKTGDMAFVKRFGRLCPNIVADEMYNGEEDLLAQKLTKEQRTAVEEAFDAIEYMHRLWYDLRPTNNEKEGEIEMKTYKVEYEVSELTNGTASGKSYSCTMAGYTSVESLKDETKEAVEKIISNHNILDGEMLLEMQISKCENGDEAYYDHDEATIRVVGGKIVEFLD